MKRLFTEHFAGRPAARIVALYSGVNLFILLPFIALFVVYRATLVLGGALPKGAEAIIGFFAWHGLLPCLIAAVFYLVLLWALRPGERRGGERIALVLTGLLAMVLLTLYSEPLLVLVVIPLAARYWLRLGSVIGLALALVAWSVYWDASQGTFSQVPASFLVATFFGVMALVVTAYVLFSFELAIRQARAREELDTLYSELDKSYQTLSRYRELELEHASLEERTRISRELHDTLGHHLTAQRFDLQVLRKVLPPEVVEARASAALARAVERNTEAIVDLRRAVQALRPEKPVSTNVLQALQELVTLWSEHAQVTLVIRGQERPLAGETGLALYRLAQEALTNALKHAPAEKLELTLAFSEDALCFEACNPISAEAAPSTSGQGLNGLKGRVQALHGSFFAGREGDRFKLWVRVPT